MRIFRFYYFVMSVKIIRLKISLAWLWKIQKHVSKNIRGNDDKEKWELWWEEEFILRVITRKLLLTFVKGKWNFLEYYYYSFPSPPTYSRKYSLEVEFIWEHPFTFMHSSYGWQCLEMLTIHSIKFILTHVFELSSSYSVSICSDRKHKKFELWWQIYLSLCETAVNVSIYQFPSFQHLNKSSVYFDK